MIHCNSRYYINRLYSIVLHNTREYQYPYSHIIPYSNLMKMFLFFCFKIIIKIVFTIKTIEKNIINIIITQLYIEEKL